VSLASLLATSYATLTGELLVPEDMSDTGRRLTHLDWLRGGRGYAERSARCGVTENN
jgi:hypothetical protein